MIVLAFTPNEIQLNTKLKKKTSKLLANYEDYWFKKSKRLRKKLLIKGYILTTFCIGTGQNIKVTKNF